MANPEHLAILEQGVEVWNAWREQNPDIRPNLQKYDLQNANLRTINFQNADLRGAKLSVANLQQANLQKAKLSGANLQNTYLWEANLKDAHLEQANLQKAHLWRASFKKALLWKADLRGANLAEVNFAEANLREVNLKHAHLHGANLQKSILVASEALFTDFSKANLTGACIAQWGINEKTNFTDVQCDFIYLDWDETNRYPIGHRLRNTWFIYDKDTEERCPTDRRPHNPDEIFAPGDFARLMEQARDTVDLIFSNGIDWQAFLTTFQNLQVSGDHGELTIQGINRKSDGSFVISVDAPQALDKAAIEQDFKKQYESERKQLEAVYQEKLQAKEQEIAIYREQNTNLNEIAKMMASRPIQIETTAMADSQSDKSVQQQFTGPVYGVAGNVEGNQVINSGDTVTVNAQSHDQSQQTVVGKMTGGTLNNNAVADPELAATVAYIQALLQQLVGNSPANTTAEQMQLATQAIAQLESNPTWKQKAIQAAKAGALEALKANPVGAFVAGAIERWTEA
ncbi:MAG: pentapeptide repeat-containing protein [Cyanobacteria bacterium P01_G01_bin.54]